MTYDQLMRYYGGCTAAATALDRAKQTVHNWKRSGIPDVDQLEIQKRTEGALKADASIVRKYRALLAAA